ncbi:MAG: YitT family protein [Clostridia bacterium]|nr:YitT family protein [Clostridia bacterium]
MQRKIRSYLIILIGIALTAIATGLFYIPNEIVTGGVSGIATILYPIGIQPGIVYLVLNLILLVLSYKILGKEFVINSILSVIVMSLLVQFFSAFPPVTDDIFLATLFGSLLFGIGASLTFIENANTGGTDIIGRLFQSKFPQFPIGTLLLIIDGIIIFVSLLIFKNIELALYGLFGLFISAFIIDFIIGRLNSSKLALVITEKGDQISKLIIQNSRRGVTVLNARGAYSGARKNLLICALKNRQIPEFHKMITDVDSNAFIIFTNSEKIFGLGFYVYK